MSALLILAGTALVLTGGALPLLVLGCALQALGAAGNLATAMNLATSARTTGLITASLAVVGATGPLVGSLLGDLLSWRAALALPALAVLAIRAAIRGTTRPATVLGRFDYAGATILTALVTALIFIPQQPVLGSLGSAAAVTLFAVHLRRRPDGLVPAAVVRSPRFLAAAGLALALAVVNFGILYAAPTLLEQRTGWTTGEIGLAMLWPYLLGGALSWVVVASSARLSTGVVTALLVGAGAAAAIMAALAVSVPILLMSMALGAIAAAAGQGALAVRATSAVPGANRPAAIGLFNLCFLLGVAFGPAIVALLLAR